MLVPIGDENPLKTIKFQYVTVALILANSIIFLLEAGAGGSSAPFVADFAVVPAELFRAGMFGAGAISDGGPIAIPERLTLVSYMFLHGDILHLLGNMLFLWVFGDNVEDAMGHVRFFCFYMACGIFAGLFHSFMLPESRDALIGASGAVAGVIAAYLMLHPRVSVWVLVLKVIPLRISAVFVLGLWILTQIAMLFVPDSGPTAWWAHIGGLAAGAILILVLRRPGVPLFGR